MLWLLHYPSSERWRGPGLVTALIFIQWHSDNWTAGHYTLASDAGDLITAISESSRSPQRKTGHSHQLMNLNWWLEPMLGPLLLCSPSSDIGNALKSRKYISRRYSPIPDDRSLRLLCVPFSVYRVPLSMETSVLLPRFMFVPFIE